MHAKYLKSLGLLVLGLVGVMAVTASAAQAEWLLLKNKESVLLLNLTVEALLGELSTNNVQVHCEKGTGTAHIHTSEDHLILLGSASIDFKECEVLENPFCEVKIDTTKGEGEAKMDGATDVYIDAFSAQFTVLHFSGPFCTLPELEEVDGTAKLSVVDPLEDLATHLVKVDEAKDSEGNSLLLLGNSPATLDGELLESGQDEYVLAHVKEAEGNTWAVHLVNL